ncbi:MAG: hypothetical protein WEB55_02795 [Acidimicrobiia bacterium]
MAQHYHFWYCFAIFHPNDKQGYLQDTAGSTLPRLHFPHIGAVRLGMQEG